MDPIHAILHLFRTHGATDYLGEPLPQRQHALEAAHLAVLDGACDALVAAALLHDVGHLLSPEEDPAPTGTPARTDDLHEEKAAAWLAPHFGPNVTEPIRLHVTAKRYLCATDPQYRRILSPASMRSLELQGGLLPKEEIPRFEANPFHRDAVRLRRWDDRAKEPELKVPDLLHYAATLRRVLRSSGR
jgi:[1-hydroxy-2-(trimethylamino)ethyl]phosphonate dioxygenase